MKKIETLGKYNLLISEGWIPINAFCEHYPIEEKTVKHYRNNGTWLDGVITKVMHKITWVNVWEVNLWFTKNF